MLSLYQFTPPFVLDVVLKEKLYTTAWNERKQVAKNFIATFYVFMLYILLPKKKHFESANLRRA